MKKFLLFLLGFTILSVNARGDIFTAVATGNWNDGATWGNTSPGVVGTDFPGTGDNAICGDDKEITVTVDAACFKLNITAEASFATVFTVNAGVTLTIEDEWEIKSLDEGSLEININGTVNVAEELDVDITHDDFVFILEVGGGGIFNLNESSTPNTIFSTGAAAETEFIVNGTVNVADQLRVESENAAETTVNINGTLNCISDKLTFETTAASSFLTAEINGTMNCEELALKVGVVAGSGSLTMNMNSGGAISLSGPLTMTGAGGDATIDASATASTFEYGGSVAQTIQLGSTIEYHNLVLSGTGTKSVEAAISNTNVLGNLTIEAGTLNSNGFDIELGGNWTNNGTFTQGSSKVTMNGGGAQSILGTTTTKFFDLEIDNASGVTATPDVELEGTLSLTSGTFTTAGAFTLTSDATRTGRIGPVSGAYTGSITIQRLIPATPGWRILAPPVSGTTMADWEAEIPMACIDGSSNHTVPHFTSVYSYDESVVDPVGNASEGYSDDDDGQTAGVGLTDALSSGTTIDGYFIWAGTCVPSCSPTTILTDLTGGLVSGTQTLPLAHTDNPAGQDDENGWNLIGNPFPSDISWDATNPTGGVSTVAYVYDTNADDFITLDKGNGADRDVIASMQGFFAHCVGVAGTLEIEEADKVADANNFLKTGNSLPRIQVTLSGNGYSDDVSLYVVPGTTENYDPKIDALNPYSMQWDFANLSIISPDDHELEFNKVSGFDQDYTVPLLINWSWPNASMSYTISLDALDDVPVSTCILLEDTLTGAFTDLRAGAYTFSMAADSGLTPRFVLHVGASVAKDRVNPTCFGASNGTGIAIGQGVGPWSYIWVNSSGDTVRTTSNSNTADTLSNAPEDTYTIYVTSSGGVCMNSVDTLVLAAPADLIANSTVADISCFGMADGSIDLDVNGGTPPYDYSWSSGQSTEDILAPTGGIYDVDVTDANGCVTTYSITVVEPAKLELSGLASDVNCNGENNGAVDITAIGGTSPYVYLWSNSESTEDIGGLAPGTYSIQVTDNNNCLADDSFEITEPIVVISTFVAQKDTAYLSDGGEVQFTNTSFGASAFEWDFDDGSPANTEVSPLHVFGAAGTYNVTMVASNANNCSDTSYKSTVIMDSPLVGIGNELTGDLSWKVNYITNGDGLFAEFSFEEPTSVDLQILNVLGQEVSRLDDIEAFRNTVKIMDLQRMVTTYLIRVDTESGSTSKKVIY